jgi:lysophospholipid acyltransferase (LPLAT)-like uncharacterized protein
MAKLKEPSSRTLNRLRRMTKNFRVVVEPNTSRLEVKTVNSGAILLAATFQP